MKVGAFKMSESNKAGVFFELCPELKRAAKADAAQRGMSLREWYTEVTLDRLCRKKEEPAGAE
jgi:hypothetical protein